MRITVLVENSSYSPELRAEHGLSLFVETEQTKLLFDMGRTDLLLQNAERLGVKIDQVDLAVVSHGHHDHGGGLGAFLAENKKANVYVHARAFERHLSLKQGGVLGEIGLNPLLRSSKQIIFVGERAEIAPGMTLFSGVNERTLFSRCNDTLYMVKDDAVVADDFMHEQNLIIAENGKLVLFAGCAHCGIVNILRRAEEIAGRRMDAVFGGFHLHSPSLKKSEPPERIRAVGEALASSGASFYTGHCTGEEAFGQLKAILGDQLTSISTGGRYEI
jgi:7,8-dihydropterin-6-yl-methyl-4-(beta-D-ribofuranosyl)aminobenzene 5'-phosphate synthase